MFPMIDIQHPKYPWLSERTILLGISGSFAYGTNIENSDRDYKGICIPPIDYYLGLQSFNEYNTAGGKNFKNTKDDIDITIMHLNKFVMDAMKGVPNNIELLFLREQDYLKLTKVGRLLMNHRHLFLTKEIEKKFRGYAYSQIQKFKKKYEENLNKEASIQYDTKLFMNTIRLLTSAIEILETGDFQTYRTNREELLACRTGKYHFNEALDLIEYYDAKLKQAFSQSRLPDKPDHDRINQLLIKLNLMTLKQEIFEKK